MMSCSVLHHIELCVSNDEDIVATLCDRWGFFPFAGRITTTARQTVLKCGSSIFVVTKRLSSSTHQSESDIQSCCEKLDTNSSDNLAQMDQDGCKLNVNLDKEYNINICNPVVVTDINKIDSKDVSSIPNTVLLQTSIPNDKEEPNSGRDYSIKPNKQINCEHWTTFCCRDKQYHYIDSIFNVALIVKDVDAVTEKVRSQYGEILREPTTIFDDFGTVRYSIVASCCGNIVHTLIDKTKYNGQFLPQFIPSNNKTYFAGNNIQNLCTENHSCEHIENEPMLNSEQYSLPNKTQTKVSKCCEDKDNELHQVEIEHNEEILNKVLTTYIDHVTFVCSPGESLNLIRWYEDCLSMNRFITNRSESEEGFVLGGNIGLRLLALEYWRCAETGLTEAGATLGDSSLKLVIAEPLPSVRESHVQTFLDAHEGPGIQHLGLHTDDIINTVTAFTNCGVQFRMPPPPYYNECGKLHEIQQAGYGPFLEKFQELGILLDLETDDVFAGLQDNQHVNRHLMQIFSKPMFGRDTFFMEVIQRCGARGFGAGNIKALAQSIIIQQKNEQVDCQQDEAANYIQGPS